MWVIHIMKDSPGNIVINTGIYGTWDNGSIKLLLLGKDKLLVIFFPIWMKVKGLLRSIALDSYIQGTRCCINLLELRYFILTAETDIGWDYTSSSLLLLSSFRTGQITTHESFSTIYNSTKDVIPLLSYFLGKKQ